MSKIKGYVPTTFRDAGTEETFEGDKEHEFEPGAYANYVAGKKVISLEAKAAADAAAAKQAEKPTPAASKKTA